MGGNIKEYAFAVAAIAVIGIGVQESLGKSVDEGLICNQRSAWSR